MYSWTKVGDIVCTFASAVHEQGCAVFVSLLDVNVAQWRQNLPHVTHLVVLDRTTQVCKTSDNPYYDFVGCNNSPYGIFQHKYLLQTSVCKLLQRQQTRLKQEQHSACNPAYCTLRSHINLYGIGERLTSSSRAESVRSAMLRSSATTL